MTGMDTAMTIGAFARRTGLSVTALRFYDRRGLLRPAGVDPTSGYRRYGVDQISRAELLRELRLLEMGLAEVARALEAGPDERRALVAAHVDRLEIRTARVRHRAHSLRNLDTKDTTMYDTTIDLRVDELRRAIRQVLPAAGTDPRAPHLMTVLLTSTDGGLRLVATDRHRLAVRDLAVAGDTGAVVGVVPSAALAEWLDDLAADDTATLTRDGDELVATAGARRAGIPIVPVDFPDHRPLLEPAAGADELVVARDTLLSALRSGGQGPITLVGGADELGLESADRVQHVAASGRGPNERTVLDLGYLTDAVAATVGAEIVIETTGPLDPVVFRSADDGTFVSLVMPIAT